MKTWQEMALEYAAEGLRPCEIAKILEKELGTTAMYDKVYNYIKRHFIKRTDEPTDKDRTIVQNHEPSRWGGLWDGTKTIRFGLMGDTQMGSKYAQLTHLHTFYDLCEHVSTNYTWYPLTK